MDRESNWAHHVCGNNSDSVPMWLLLAGVSLSVHPDNQYIHTHTRQSSTAQIQRSQIDMAGRKRGRNRTLKARQTRKPHKFFFFFLELKLEWRSSLIWHGRHNSVAVCVIHSRLSCERSPGWVSRRQDWSKWFQCVSHTLQVLAVSGSLWWCLHLFSAISKCPYYRKCAKNVST